MKKNKSDISRNIVVVLLIVAVLVSVFNVFTIINVFNNKITGPQVRESIGQAKIDLEEQQAPKMMGGANINVKILPAS